MSGTRPRSCHRLAHRLPPPAARAGSAGAHGRSAPDPPRRIWRAAEGGAGACDRDCPSQHAVASRGLAERRAAASLQASADKRASRWGGRVRTLRIVLGDQCSDGLSALAGLDPATDVVLMAEVIAECTYVKHHPKKIVLVLSAMRHFAAALRAQGRAGGLHHARRPGQHRQPARRDAARGGAPPARPRRRDRARRVAAARRISGTGTTRPGCRSISATTTAFCAASRSSASWARGRGAFRMEFFYRDMRRRYGVLMDDGAPAGGQWNYDPENRKPLPKHIAPPPRAALPAGCGHRRR